MKTISVLSTLLFVFFTTFSFAQAKPETSQENIKVWGNCGMCKKTIETAAKSAGATSADWNDETKILMVSFNSNAGSDKIQQAIAAAGYDTEKFTADQKAYDKLHSCCQYDRKSTSAGLGAAKSDCCKDGKCIKDNTSCCNAGKCDKDTACCKDKSCCKS